jgi:transposase
MCSLPVFVGLDYHQQSVQVCVLNADGTVRCNRGVGNDVDRLVRAVESFGQPAAVAIEACCGAADLAEKLIREAGWPVRLAHPGFVRRMKQNPDKTDFSDARLLADLSRVGYLPAVWLAPQELRRLRRLVRYRQQRVDERRNIKLRLRALLRENRLRPPPGLRLWTRAGVGWLKHHAALVEDDRWIADEHLRRLLELNGEIDAIERRLCQRTADDPVMHKLLALDGVGPVTAAMLRAEVGHFDRFQTGKQLSRFCGLSPRNASSGERQADAGLIRAGNPQLRVVLVELAHRLIRQGNGRWGQLAYDLLQRGKPKCVVVAAVANRYVRWLHHTMQPAAA